MKEKFITSIMCLLLTTMSLSMFMPATIGSPAMPTPCFPGGDGSPGNPYHIANVSDLQNMSTDLSASYILINDIDATNTSVPGHPLNNGGLGFDPIGDDTTQFSGSLNGNNYTITGLYINRPSQFYVGLFGYLGIGSSIDNLGLKMSNHVGNWISGGLVGRNSGTITNCHISGTVTAAAIFTGGLVGYNTGTIMSCSANSTVNGVANNKGGFVGASTGTIMDCYSTASVSGASNIGSFVGENSGTITNCSSTGNAIGTANNVGGFAGENDGGTVTNCYSTGSASGNDQVGGFVGYNLNFGTITNCYSTGDATGTTDVGGFVGWNKDVGVITNCYSTGNASGGSNLGGFAGWNDDTITNCFWDNETSGTVTGIGGGTMTGATGKNTTDMMTQATFTGAGWGFISTWFNIDGETRPFLQMEHSNKIKNSHQLQLMAMDLAADYELASDVQMDILDASQMWGTNATQGKGFLPVGNSTDMFTGTLDGGNFDINGLYINRSGENNVGLLGRIVTPAEITNITLTNVNASGGENTAALVGYSAGGTLKNCHVACEVWGYGNFVGGLMGYNSLGTVDNSSFDGNVTANVNYVGGLIGRSTGPVTYCTSGGTVIGAGWTGGLIGDTLNSGSVENSTSSSIVDGNSNVGGLIGRSSRPVGHSSASGDVSGGNQVGGLVGYNSATITNCTSTGNATAIGAGDYIGGLVGRNEGGTLTDCHSTGDTSGDWYVGGFIGYSTGSITNCTSTGTVSGTVAGGSQGGFVGENHGPIMNCSSTGNASGGDVSGFVELNYGPITNCHSTGNVNGTGMAIGGFVGWNDDSITTSYSTGNTIGVEDVGGFLGDNVGGTITKCFSTGDVTGTSGVNSFAAGFIGVNAAGGQIMNCYSTGNAIGAGNYNGGFAAGNYNSMITNCYSIGNASGGSNTGGFLGFNSTGTTTDCFWDVEYSGTIPSDGGTPKNTAEMKQQATFDPPWDFTTIWGIYEYNTYPFLQAISPTYVPEADLEITIGGTPEPCNVGDALMYTVTVTNNGPDIAVNPVVNITLPVEVTWLNDSQGIGPPTGQYLEAAIGNLDSGETGGSFINVSVDTYAVVISATAKIVSDTADSNLSNNIDWANTTLNRAPNAVDDNYNVDEDSGPNTLDVLGDDTDLDDDELTISVVTQGTNGTVTIIDSGKNVTYEPDADYVGSDTFTYTIDDGNGGTDIGTVTIDVLNINDAPVITTTDVTTATEDVLYTVDYDATDIDPSDTLTWSLTTDAGWLSIVATTGVLSGTPTNDDVGAYLVNVTVSDGNGGLDWSSFTLTVSNTNDAPVISTTTAPDGTEGQPYFSQVNATDADGDTLTWSLTSNATWLTINTTGGLSGTPISAGTFWANVVVDDGNGGTDSVNLTLVITSSGTTTPTDTDGDGVPDDQDAFPTDPTETTDTDGDDVGDNADAFPTDPAASVDTDGDGDPDDWNPGYTADDSTTGLVEDLDDDNDGILDVDDDNPLTADGDASSNTWLYLIIILVIVGIAGAVLVLRPKGPKPMAEGPVEEIPQEPPEEPEASETAEDTETIVEP